MHDPAYVRAVLTDAVHVRMDCHNRASAPHSGLKPVVIVGLPGAAAGAGGDDGGVSCSSSPG